MYINILYMYTPNQIHIISTVNSLDGPCFLLFKDFHTTPREVVFDGTWVNGANVRRQGRCPTERMHAEVCPCETS